MKTLILGAGATGGYFGARLLEAGADVSFLVRPKRAQLLLQNGLNLKSQFGDYRCEKPPLCTSADSLYDLVVLSCKAYDLDSSIDAIAGAVGEKTVILPLLNGVAHFEKLQSRFGKDKVLGGLCIISSTVDDAGTIKHLNDVHAMKYGEFSGELSERVKAFDAICKQAKFNSVASERINQDIWEKWVMIASLAALTTAMRGNVGQIVSSPGGKQFAGALFDECLATMRAHEVEVRTQFESSNRERLQDESSTLAASMLRDLEGGRPVESDQIIGDLIQRAEAKNVSVPNLRIAYCGLKVYETKRAIKN